MLVSTTETRRVPSLEVPVGGDHRVLSPQLRGPFIDPIGLDQRVQKGKKESDAG